MDTVMTKARPTRTSVVARVLALPAMMFAAATLSTAAANAADATGTWLNEDQDAIVQIADCATPVTPPGAPRSAAAAAPSGGALCGTVVWLKTPIDPATGAPATDKKNADPALRQRAILGMRGISNMRPTSTARRWDGRVYNIDDGKSYDGRMILKSESQLRVEGCMLLICQGETWTRTALPAPPASPAGTAPARPSSAAPPQRAR